VTILADGISLNDRRESSPRSPAGKIRCATGNWMLMVV
jgi:hypothetical protein